MGGMDNLLCMYYKLSPSNRYETDGLKFFPSTKEHRNGPNNIVDLWKAFHIGKCTLCSLHNRCSQHSIELAEQSDSQEVLESDNDGYPKVLENVLELCLHRRKAILRLFMAATRH